MAILYFCDKQMKNTQNTDLQPYNTFGIHCQVAELIELESMEDLLSLDPFPKDAIILAGGSNVLFTEEQISRPVLLNRMKGIELGALENGKQSVVVSSGEVWDEFVQYTIAQNLGGLENLSLIPGSVGAAPMQNIGAYGVEVDSCIDWVEYLDLHTREVVQIPAADCAFGYRTSIFKTKLKNKIFITRVAFHLDAPPTKLHLEYGAIRTKLEEMGVTEPTISDVSKAVVNIRQSKLPDPKKIGNAGSFFKNPIVSKEKFVTLPQSSEMPIFELPDNQVKIPAAWLIEKCGWKAYREGEIGVYQNQALVLVNYGNGKGKEIYDLSERIITSVYETFSISLEREVNIL